MVALHRTRGVRRRRGVVHSRRSTDCGELRARSPEGPKRLMARASRTWPGARARRGYPHGGGSIGQDVPMRCRGSGGWQTGTEEARSDQRRLQRRSGGLQKGKAAGCRVERRTAARERRHRFQLLRKRVSVQVLDAREVFARGGLTARRSGRAVLQPQRPRTGRQMTASSPLPPPLGRPHRPWRCKLVSEV